MPTLLSNKRHNAQHCYKGKGGAETLDELDRVKSPALVSLAVKIGKTRLIDNIVLE